MTKNEEQTLKELMIKYGFKAPDMTVTEFVEDVLPSAQPELAQNLHNACTNLISRKEVIKLLDEAWVDGHEYQGWLHDEVNRLPSAQPNLGKYEYHYDHTDCIWYRPEARNRCPVTCAQYRDGWNDAMNYIFRDGKGYMPYRRDKQYGE